NSYTLMVEPSVLIRGVHPSVRQELRASLEEVAGVSFTVKDGANLVVVLNNENQVPQVTKEIESLLKQYQILELRFPMGFEVDTQLVGDKALAVLKDHLGSAGTYENVT